MPSESPLSPALSAALAAALAQPPSRILPLDVAGRRYWLKRPEAHRRWVRRLQKGDPGRAFAADCAGLALLGARGLPVPAVLAQGPGHVLIADAGRPVATILRDPETPEADKRRALVAAAGALAQVHHAGIAHGRPKIRDICWDPAHGATLIDLEAHRALATRRDLGRDAVVFLHSILQIRHQRDALFEAALQAYRQAAPEGVFAEAQAQTRRSRRIAPLARLALALQPRAHEVRAALLLQAALAE